MARILQLNGLMWCADMLWRDYGQRPSSLRLRADGQRDGATHYARYPGRPHSAAFLTISKSHARGGLNSLAIATAAALGPLAYAEFDMGGGELWVIATDEDGELLPGSDQFYTADTLAVLANTLAGQPFSSREKVAEEALQDWFTRLQPAPVSLHPVSLRTLYTALAATALLGLGGMAIWSVYSAHEAERLARAAREAAEASRRNAPPAIPPSGPSEIVAACMQAINQLPPLSHGWALATLQCDQGGLTTHWLRAGGTLLDAPPGHIAGNADTTDMTQVIHPAVGRAGQLLEGDPVRLFVGMLQRAGITPVVAAGKTQATPAAGSAIQFLTVRFAWPADPRAITWNAYPHLSQINLRRTVLNQGLGAATDGYDITAVFAVKETTP